MLRLLSRLRDVMTGESPVWLDVGTVPVLGCVLHRSHSPAHRTVEGHHLIPVAWQLLAAPPKPWPREGKDPDGRGLLWDARLIEVCPTGHRNVHLWITRLMHALAPAKLGERPAGDQEAGGSEDPLKAVKVVRAQYGGTIARGLEFDTALLALVRWKEAGLSLQALVSAGEWGISLPAPRLLAQGGMPAPFETEDIPGPP